MFVVENGSGLSNSISYASSEDLMAYASVRMGFEHIDVSNGQSFSESQLNKALVTASSMIDRFSFSGRKASKYQNMQWPRCNVVNRCDECDCIDSNTIPRQIVEATIILASEILKGAVSIDANSSPAKIKRASFGDMSFEFSGSGAVLDGGASCGGGMSTVSQDKFVSIRHLIDCFRKNQGIKFVRGF